MPCSIQENQYSMSSKADPDRLIRYRLEVTGQVQGVGFRPFVYNLAGELKLAGFVANDSTGAVIEVEGTTEAIEAFCKLMIERQPPLARIKNISRSNIDPLGERQFQIKTSGRSGSASAEVTIDTAVCRDCLREMSDPSDRRFKYPFINCTNCGPRYTIVTSIPYDRPNTTMKKFHMCPQCSREYQDPADRRFHAQPIACPHCGPRLTLIDKHGVEIPRDAIEETANLIRAGRIVAIKGIGGFHLAVDAANHGAVGRLRRLKRRDYKPFAVMAPDLETIESICELDDHSRVLLTDIARPVVILPRRDGGPIAPQVAPGLDSFAVFLPYAPHHYLLFEQGLGILVMTSGNISDEPLAKDNDEAMTRLRDIADAFLVHDRPIYRRVDDSVVQWRPGGLMMIRRARGFVPQTVDLGCESPHPILAVGAELKNTVTIAKGPRAVMSEHVGDLKDATVFQHFKETIGHLCRLYQLHPEAIAADMHPDYLSTQYALGRVELELIQVQHHHAHVVACMAEHGLEGDVIGISCDGVGFGPDGAVWGCELLIADRAQFTRAGHLRYFPLPGGDAAAKQTFRPALGLLYQVFGPEVLDADIAKNVCPDRQIRRTILQMIERTINCPQTSSLGRLFDAAAAITQLTGVNYYEGQAPMLLEARAKGQCTEAYDYQLDETDDMLIIDPRAMIAAIVTDVEAGLQTEIIADKFHNTVAEFLTSAAERLAGKFGLQRVILTGGCFTNKYLSTRVRERLSKSGLICFEHKLIPCNDAGISLGQAACAAARLSKLTGAAQK